MIQTSHKHTLLTPNDRWQHHIEKMKRNKAPRHVFSSAMLLLLMSNSFADSLVTFDSPPDAVLIGAAIERSGFIMKSDTLGRMALTLAA